MGKEAQFARAEVAPVVAEIFAGTFSDVRRSLSQEIWRRFLGKFLPNDPSAAIGLDLMNRPHHHARQIKGEI